MNTLIHIVRFEWKRLWRNNKLNILIWVVLGAGIYGILFGKFEIDKQASRIAQVQEFERQQFDSLLYWIDLDTSIASNKVKFQRSVSPTGVSRNKHFTYYVANDAPPLAGLCLGQRDLYPVYYGLNITDLARQMNIGELANPMKLLTGNFDLSYVFVFLFPLLIVAFFYDLFAAEWEGGTLPLLQAQAVKLSKVLLGKGIVRFTIVTFLATGLLLLGFLIQGISLVHHMGYFFNWLGLILGYSLFWMMIMLGIVALRQDSALSAMYGLGIWLLVTIVTPALLNLWVQAVYASPNRAETIHAVRTLNDQIWESPKSFVFEDFYAKNPEYNLGDTLQFDKWYHAGFTLLDEQANTLNRKFEAQVLERNKLINQWRWLAPGALVHEQLSKIAGTDRMSHLRFIKSIQEFHKGLKSIYYPKIFTEEAFTKTDLNKLELKLKD